MKEVLVLGSTCTRTTYYLDTVQQILDDLGVEVTVRKIIDPEEMKQYGVNYGCSNAYCPGCNSVNIDRGDKHYTPALVVDGELVFHSSFPRKKVFVEELTQRAGKA